MRNVKSILAALVILVSSTGTTIAIHYCGKSLQDVAVFGKAKPCCGGMEMPAGCCHDEKVQIKSDSFNAAPQILNIGFVSFLICEIAFPGLDFSTYFQNSASNFVARLDNAHPPEHQDIIVFVHSFLI